MNKGFLGTRALPCSLYKHLPLLPNEGQRGINMFKHHLENSLHTFPPLQNLRTPALSNPHFLSSSPYFFPHELTCAHLDRSQRSTFPSSNNTFTSSSSDDIDPHTLTVTIWGSQCQKAASASYAPQFPPIAPLAFSVGRQYTRY